MAQELFSDDFEDRLRDQALIGNNWTWYDQTWDDPSWVDGLGCAGDPSGGFGPYSPGATLGYEHPNNNFFTVGGDWGYFRAGLEVPAWDGALSNMLRVYGNQYFGNVQCERVLIFQEHAGIEAGAYTFSFDVAKDRYGAPANGEITGAFVKVLQSSAGYETLYYEYVLTNPPSATSPGDVTTNSQFIKFNIPEEWAGELLQFGFYNDISKPEGHGWGTSGAYYDNVVLAESESGETEYTVRTDWVVFNEDAGVIDYDAEVTLTCDTPITGYVISNGSNPVSVEEKELVVVLQNGDSVTASVQVIDGQSQCQASQVVEQQYIEIDASEECDGVTLAEGDSETCVFEITAFFEGVPTIGAYGKAIMILMLLGVGFVAVRRFA